MRILETVFIVCFGCTILCSQSSLQNLPKEELNLGIQNWMGNLYEYGVRTENDTLIVSSEVQNTLKNLPLMEFMFPEKYTWETTIALMEKMELKKAIWYLINIYPDDKESVMKVLLQYDRIFPIDRILLSTFYTYGMIDKKVCSLEDGKLKILRPDIVETKLASVKQMIEYIVYYRSLPEKK